MTTTLKLLTLGFFLITLTLNLYSSSDTQVVGNTTSLKNKPDTVVLVYQQFYFDSLLDKLDTQNVQITIMPEERTFSMTSRPTGKNETHIIRSLSGNFSVERLPKIIEQKCRVEKDTSLISSDLGVILSGSCWRESSPSVNSKTGTKVRGGVWSDSGVRKIYSMEFGLIMEKGFQTQSGRVIYSVNGELISVKTRMNLIKK